MSAKARRTLPVTYAPAALQELDAIWDWNEKSYGRTHAAGYLDYVERQLARLGRWHGQGAIVSVRPDLRYIIIRRKAKGHGHVVVYRVSEIEVSVLHVFHTAQDWQSKVTHES